MNKLGAQWRSWRQGFVQSRGWLVLGVLCLISPLAHCQSLKPKVERVVIDSRWGGLNPEMPFHAHIVIERVADGYRLTGGHSKGRYGKPLPEQAFPAQTIAPQQVARLADAMGAPSQPLVDLRDLEPAIDDVQRDIDDVLKEAKLPKASTGLGEEVLAWRQSLRNPRVLAETVTKGFGATHTDDGPFVDVEVTQSDGTKLTAQSRSQQYLMLPWINAQGERTYATGISHALDDLLPKGTINKERLENTQGGSNLDEMLDFALSVPVERFQAESEAPYAVHVLDDNFRIISVSIDSWDGRPYLQADLQLRDGPPNLRLSTRLPLNGKSIANKSDIARIRQMLQLVESSPALESHIKSTPKVDFYIFDGYGWGWLNEQTAEQFINQMQQQKKLPELRAQSSLMRGAVMVEEGDSPIYWIVLTDRRSVIWKEAVSNSDKSAAGSCASIPIADSGPVDINDICIGKVYGADGREQ